MPPAAARHGHALDLRTAFALARDEVHAHSAPPLPSLAVRRKRGEAQLLPEPLTQIVLPPPPVPVAPPASTPLPGEEATNVPAEHDTVRWRVRHAAQQQPAGTIALVEQFLSGGVADLFLPPGPAGPAREE